MAARTNTKRSFQQAARYIEKAQKRMGRAAPSGLRVIGEEIMTDVKASRPGAGVPVDTGALRSTGRVEGPKNNVVILSFGGVAAPYALVQHEDMTLHHTVGEPRYLVRGVERWQAHGLSVSAAFKDLQKAIDEVAQR